MLLTKGAWRNLFSVQGVAASVVVEREGQVGREPGFDDKKVQKNFARRGNHLTPSLAKLYANQFTE